MLDSFKPNEVAELLYFGHTGQLLGSPCFGNGQLLSMNLSTRNPDGTWSQGVEYYYVRNAQNDIIGLLDSTGNEVVHYTYDSWGKLISIKDENGNDVTNDTTHVGYKNPYRYRGYCYDNETGLFYVGSRYYDPQIGRWLNADDGIDAGAGLIGTNLFAYCANNPVMYMDQTGESITLACIAIGAGIVGGLYGAHRASSKGYTIKDGWKYLKYVLGYGLAGSAAGALLGWGVGAAASAIGTYLATGSGGTLGTVVYSSWQKAEQALRSAYNGISKAFDTPFGRRIVDSYSKNIIREAKYGYQGLSQFIQQEINKDVWILNNTNVKSIEWHFYWSQVSNSGGPSGPLLKELARCGIKVIFH